MKRERERESSFPVIFQRASREVTSHKKKLQQGNIKKKYLKEGGQQYLHLKRVVGKEYSDYYAVNNPPSAIC